MNELLKPVLVFAAMFVVGVCWWALGQWLRKRGHSNTLDHMDQRTARAQRVVGRMASPFGFAVIEAVSAFSRMRLFGSRRQREVWDNLPTKADEGTKKKTSRK